MITSHTTVTKEYPALEINGTVFLKDDLVFLCTFDIWANDFGYVELPHFSPAQREVLEQEGLIQRRANGFFCGSDNLKEVLVQEYGDSISCEWK